MVDPSTAGLVLEVVFKMTTVMLEINIKRIKTKLNCLIPTILTDSNSENKQEELTVNCYYDTYHSSGYVGDTILLTS